MKELEQTGHKVGLLTLLTVCHSLSRAPKRQHEALATFARRSQGLGLAFMLPWVARPRRR